MSDLLAIWPCPLDRHPEHASGASASKGDDRADWSATEEIVNKFRLRLYPILSLSPRRSLRVGFLPEGGREGFRRRGKADAGEIGMTARSCFSDGHAESYRRSNFSTQPARVHRDKNVREHNKRF
jgi:hypothetical protein